MRSVRSSDRSDRFGAVELSPRQDQPLIVPGSTSLDAMTSACMAISLRVVSAMSLRPMRKGLTSNPVCEISLIYDDGSNRINEPWPGQKDKFHNSPPTHKIAVTQHTKPLRSSIVKSSLNPIWNFDVDFGDVDTESIVGVLFVVKHVEKFGLVKKDIGQLVLSLREVMDLKLQPPHEQTYHLQPTEEIMQLEAIECNRLMNYQGPSNRKYGKLTVRFNGYAVTKESNSNYTMISEYRPSNIPDVSIVNEDDFGKSDRALQIHHIQAEVKKLQSFHQTKPVPGETWYAINTKWIQNWLLFVSKHKGDPNFTPGSIDNMPLISDDLMNGTFQVRSNLAIKTDFRMINKKSWDYYVMQYGGGPAIEVRIPKDCANTSAWIYHIKLDEAGRVGSNYVDSDSD